MNKIFLILICLIFVLVSCKNIEDRDLTRDIYETKSNFDQPLKDEYYTFEIAEQPIVSHTGAKYFNGKTPIYSLPTEQSQIISSAGFESNVNVMTTVESKEGTQWALIENFQLITENALYYGYVPMTTLSDISSEEINIQSNIEKVSIAGISVGEDITKPISLFDGCYYEFKTNNNGHICFKDTYTNNTEEGVEQDLYNNCLNIFYDKVTNKITGIRLTSAKYFLESGLNLEADVDEVIEYYETKFERINDDGMSENIVLFDLGHNYVLMITIDGEKILEISIVPLITLFG